MVLTLERKFFEHQHVKNKAATPNIDLVVIWLHVEHLRSSKLGCSGQCPHLLLALVESPGYIEINQFDLDGILLHQENVFRLYVPMDYRFVLQIIYSTQQLV